MSVRLSPRERVNLRKRLRVISACLPSLLLPDDVFDELERQEEEILLMLQVQGKEGK